MKAKVVKGRIRLCCDRCDKPEGPEFFSEAALQRWYADVVRYPDSDEEEDLADCLTCDGTGYVPHECDCDLCMEDEEDCPDCNGYGGVEDNMPPICQFFHKTLLDRAYCLKCVDAMIEESKQMEQSCN